MSDSSDDDILNLLPGGGAGKARGAPPQRLRNFKAMLTDSSSDDDIGKAPPPKPASKRSGGAKLPDFGTPATASPTTPAAQKQATPVKSPTPQQPAASPAGGDDDSDTSVNYQPDSTSDDDDDSDDVALPGAGGSGSGAVESPAKKRSESSAAIATNNTATENTDVNDVSFNLNSASPSQARFDASMTPPASAKKAEVDEKSAGQQDALVNAHQEKEQPKQQQMQHVDTSNISPVSKTIPKYAPKQEEPPEIIERRVPPPTQQAEPPVVQEEPAIVTKPEPNQQQPAVQQKPVVVEAVAQPRLTEEPQPQEQPQRRVMPPPPQEKHDSDDDEIDSILPRERPQQSATVGTPPPAQRGQQLRGYSPVARSMNDELPPARARTPSSPGVAAKNDGLDALLARAQQRLKQRDSEDDLRKSQQQLPPSRGQSPSPGAMYHPPTQERYGRSASATLLPPTTSSNPNDSLLAGPNSESFASVRLQRENARLCEELAFLTKENQQLKQQSSGRSSAAAQSKLELEIEVLKNLEAQARSKLVHIETQLEDSKDHEVHLKDEIKAYVATVEKYEVLMRDKDAQIAQEQGETAKLRVEVHDRKQEILRVKEDSERAKQDDGVRMERHAQLLEDAKKQRIHLTELNDKFARDKDTAVNERRRIQEELKSLQLEQNRDKEQFADDMAQVRRDLERQRAVTLEKERSLGAQLAEERRAKEVYQSKLMDVEEQQQAATNHQNELLKSVRDEHRVQIEALRDELQQAAEKLVEVNAKAEKFAAEQHDQALRAAAEESQRALQQLRTAEQARDEATNIAAQLDEDCRQIAKERDGLSSDLQRAMAAAEEWQKAKEANDVQITKLSSTLNLMLMSDDKLQRENEQLRSELNGANAELENIRMEVDTCVRLEQQMQQLTAENDRLSEECGRHARERAELIRENGQMADEMIKWRQEVRDLLAKRSAVEEGASHGGGVSRRIASTHRDRSRDFIN